MAQRPQASPVVRNAAAPPPIDEAPEVEPEPELDETAETQEETEVPEEPADSED